MTDSTHPHRLLIATVGGSAGPLVFTCQQWQPERVRFLPTEGTQHVIDEILNRLADGTFRLLPGQCDRTILQAENFEACVARLRPLTQEVLDWAGRGPGFEVILDFTGGTKCMTAALVTVARSWPCTFSYIGGLERDKDGKGAVIDGKEYVHYASSPWHSLGYQSLENWHHLFNLRQYQAARLALEPARDQAPEARKGELAALLNLTEAYEHWDRFRHGQALDKLGNGIKRRNDLQVRLRHAEQLPLEGHLERLAALGKTAPPSRVHLLDLLANAERRGSAYRYDDAVARFYRFFEACAQVRLAEAHGRPESGKLVWDELPTEFRNQLGVCPREDGTVALGLKNTYGLLAALGDPLGTMYESLNMKSVLQIRNDSILAHGWVPISAGDYERLRETTWALADGLGITEADLVVFPTLGELI